MLSIIIPTLNEEKYIGNLLKCLKNQTFRDFEVIIVDFSSDNTKVIINNYKQYLKLRLINHKKGNISKQRNSGVKNAKYENLLFIDADTTFNKNFLKDSLYEIKKRKLKTAGCHIYPDKKIFLYSFYFSVFHFFSLLSANSFGINGCCIFSGKKLHEKIGGFNSKIKIAEDYDYTKRLSRLTKIGILKTNINTSVRRFEKYGKFKTVFRLLFLAFHRALIGEIRKKIVDYEFGRYDDGAKRNRKF